MRLTLADNWWSLIIRGILAILLGVLTFVSPRITVKSLVILFGVYALLDGVTSLVGAWHASRRQERWGALIFEGFAGIATAAITMLWPGLTLMMLVFLIAAWAIITGVGKIAAAIRLRRYIEGEWVWALTGVASIVFGVLLMMAPFAGAIAIALWLGAFAFVIGIFMIVLAFRLHSWAKDHGEPFPLPSH